MATERPLSDDDSKNDFVQEVGMLGHGTNSISRFYTNGQVYISNSFKDLDIFIFDIEPGVKSLSVSLYFRQTVYNADEMALELNVAEWSGIVGSPPIMRFTFADHELGPYKLFGNPSWGLRSRSEQDFPISNPADESHIVHISTRQKVIIAVSGFYLEERRDKSQYPSPVSYYLQVIPGELSESPPGIPGGALTEGADTLEGSVGPDKIEAQAGNDTINGAGGADTIVCGTGDDVLAGGSGADVLDGGAGLDIVDYGMEGGSAGVSVNLLVPAPADPAFAVDTYGEFDALFGIENIGGTNFADIMYGNNEANVLLGRAGGDQLVGWGGADSIDGGEGDDVILGWLGADSLVGWFGNDWLWAGDGSDTVVGGDGLDVLVGDLPGSSEVGFDLIIGGLGGDILQGGAGADTLIGGADTGAASDTGARNWLVGGAGNDLMFGGGGDDVIWEQLDLAEGGSDSVWGGDGDDIILAGSGADFIDGGLGNDTIYGGKGADTIIANFGADVIWITIIDEMGDIIFGFTPGQDKLAISSILGGKMTIYNAFVSRIFYFFDSSELRYDVDGSGPSPSLVVANFAPYLREIILADFI